MFTEEFLISLLENGNETYTDAQLTDIKFLLDCHCSNYNIKKKSTELMVVDDFPYCYKAFCVSKKTEGMSDKSLETYNSHLRNFFKNMLKPIEQITTDDIRIWLCMRGQKVSGVTLDNERAILNSFFTWIYDNEYISHNPMKKIGKIKYVKKARKALNEEELERLRNACKTPREKAIIEVLFSTGCRVEELESMKISDIDFEQKHIKTLVTKGSEEDYCQLNAKAILSIKEYLKTRTDNCDDLIYSTKTKRGISISQIETIVKTISVRAGIKRCTPHVIRHTTATIAVKRGMPLEEVSSMLHHKSIDTTKIYFEINNEKLKYDHAKCVV